MELLCADKDEAEQWIAAFREAMLLASRDSDWYQCPDAALRALGCQEDTWATQSTSVGSSPAPSFTADSSPANSGDESSLASSTEQSPSPSNPAPLSEAALPPPLPLDPYQQLLPRLRPATNTSNTCTVPVAEVPEVNCRKPPK